MTDAAISIHDVMPTTLGEVADILGVLEAEAAGPVQLLVVPGLPWTGEGIDQLRAWQLAGHELVGHGWQHRVDQINGLSHRLHSLFLSRNVAEHLALDEDGIADLIARCHAWFATNDLAAPDYYVPPAWAMGRISRGRLAQLPFRRYEVFSGVIDGESGRLDYSPLAGFEADTLLRAAVLKVWNGSNVILSGTLHRPLRISIHPFDLTYALSNDLKQLVRRFTAP